MEIAMTSSRLLIENLDNLTTEEHLENIFSTYGDVNKVMVRRDRGFVDMMSASEAKRARENLDGSNLWGRSMKIHTMNDTLRYRMMYLFSRFFR
jgi:RNA recognition motif-containing protein